MSSWTWFRIFDFYRTIFYRKTLFIRYKIDSQFNQYLFLTWWWGSDQECERYESWFIDLWETISSKSMLVLSQKPDEEECTNTFVPIWERMIFDDKIEKVSRLRFDRWIEISIIKSLSDRLKYSTKLFILLIAEELCRFSPQYKRIPQLHNSLFCLIILDRIRDIPISIITESSRVKLTK